MKVVEALTKGIINKIAYSRNTIKESSIKEERQASLKIRKLFSLVEEDQNAKILDLY